MQAPDPVIWVWISAVALVLFILQGVIANV